MARERQRRAGDWGGDTQLLTAHHSANYLVFAIVTNLYYAAFLIEQIKLQLKK